MKKPEFTQEQKDYICYQIGEWYIKWKDRLINFDDRTHRLGYAKEILKVMICESREEMMETLMDIANGLKTLDDVPFGPSNCS